MKVLLRNHRFLVHIGYPKAASTWLQKNVFSGADALFAPFGGAEPSPRGYRKPGADLLFDYPGEGYGAPRPCVAPFRIDTKARQERIGQHAAADGRVTCFSNELWAGHPFSGGLHAPIFAARLQACLPQAKILIVVRNQADMILSSYFQYLVRREAPVSLEQFMRPQFGLPEAGFSPYYFDYRALIEHYDGLFGRQNVICLPFEMIRLSHRAFVAPLYRAFGASPPARLDATPVENMTDDGTAALLSLAPWLNRLHHNGPRRAGVAARQLRKAALRLSVALLPKSVIAARIRALRERIASVAGEFYHPGNAWLSERLGMELEPLGYASRRAAIPIRLPRRAGAAIA